MIFSGSGKLNNSSGFSMVEMLMALAIFSIITVGVFSALDAQMGHSRKESIVGQSDIEFIVAKSLIERDLAMAGFGLADDYAGFGPPSPATEFNPRAYQSVNSDTAPDELRLMGTALGVNSRQAQGWTYLRAIDESVPSISYATWSDARENLQDGDRVVVMDPSTKTLLGETDGTDNYWLFEYQGNSAKMTIANPDIAVTPFSSTSRHVVYGLYGSDNDEDDTEATLTPYYSVRYYRSSSTFSAETCAEGTRNLLRAESRKNESPDNGDPVLSCVLDFQVAFGLDRDENDTIETWDDGGETYVNGYTRENQRKRLKQVRVYLLVQSGRRDPAYTYPQNSIRVGETLIIDGVSQTTGRLVTLTDAQKQYRWKLIALNITPRNLR
jgi:prepilin-type N-terminal cleavage/methylation domain-containing protein